MLSLYIHIPFCLHKCSYCDFFSIGTGGRGFPGAEYAARVVEELRVLVEQYNVRGRTLRSIFFGGGTPSMLPAESLAAVLSEARAHFEWPDDLEITCEANPETITEDIAQSLQQIGITRLSIGIQSFQPRHLQFLERVHSVERAISAVQAANRAGFRSVSADLIYGLPQQTDEEFADDLTQLVALNTSHVSAYQLTVEPNTPLAAQVQRGEITPIDADAAHEKFTQARAFFRAHDLLPYEISNFAREGFACAHNLHYWQGGEYLGIGTGAVSRVGRKRWRRRRQLAPYLAGALHEDDVEILTREQLRFEYCMLVLRTSAGLNLQRFAEFCDQTFDEVYPHIRERWREQGWLASPAEFALSESGFCVLDSLLLELTPA